MEHPLNIPSGKWGQEKSDDEGTVDCLCLHSGQHGLSKVPERLQVCHKFSPFHWILQVVVTALGMQSGACRWYQAQTWPGCCLDGGMDGALMRSWCSAHSNHGTNHGNAPPLVVGKL
jgi:hypothetical protein